MWLVCIIPLQQLVDNNGVYPNGFPADAAALKHLSSAQVNALYQGVPKFLEGKPVNAWVMVGEQDGIWHCDSWNSAAEKKETG
jgi:hypothetical protein